MLNVSNVTVMCLVAECSMCNTDCMFLDFFFCLLTPRSRNNGAIIERLRRFGENQVDVSDYRMHGFDRTGLSLGDAKIRISNNSTSVTVTVSTMILSLMLSSLTFQE